MVVRGTRYTHFVLVNIDNSPVSVEGLDNVKEFAASTRTSPPARDVVGVRVDDDGEHVWIDPAVISAAAEAAEMPATWTADFDGMRQFAQTRGWIDERGWIRAHVVAD